LVPPSAKSAAKRFGSACPLFFRCALEQVLVVMVLPLSCYSDMEDDGRHLLCQPILFVCAHIACLHVFSPLLTVRSSCFECVFCRLPGLGVCGHCSVPNSHCGSSLVRQTHCGTCGSPTAPLRLHLSTHTLTRVRFVAPLTDNTACCLAGTTSSSTAHQTSSLPFSDDTLQAGTRSSPPPPRLAQPSPSPCVLGCGETAVYSNTSTASTHALQLVSGPSSTIATVRPSQDVIVGWPDATLEWWWRCQSPHRRVSPSAAPAPPSPVYFLLVRSYSTPLATLRACPHTHPIQTGTFSTQQSSNPESGRGRGTQHQH